MCNCEKSQCEGRCKCRKNNLVCTEFCKCEADEEKCHKIGGTNVEVDLEDLDESF